jgi:hypothetical protein
MGQSPKPGIWGCTLRSVLTDDLTHCYICGAPYPQIHHIFFGRANRKKSEHDGCIVPLCIAHHTQGRDAVHLNRTVDLRLKQAAETEWIEEEIRRGMTEDQALKAFRFRYGKSWL